MGQSKWCLPRHRHLQQSKEAANLLRPRIKIHAVWTHGVSLHLFLIHPLISGDSSLVIETFQRVLQETVERFKAKQRRIPDTVLVWEARLMALRIQLADL